VSSAKRDVVTYEVDGKSFIKWLYRSGERHEPCGTPVSIFLSVDVWSESLILKVRFVRKD